MKRGYILAAGAVLFLSIAGVGGAAKATGYPNGEYCREYTKTIYVGGRAQEGYGKACLQPDGAWQFYNENQEIIAPVPNMALPVQPRNVSHITYYNHLDYYLRPFGWHPGSRHVYRPVDRHYYYYDGRRHGNPHHRRHGRHDRHHDNRHYGEHRFHSYPYAWR